MKQKSRFLAFLLALGLLASLAVTPAAAASLSELQSAVDTAQAELTDAQTALDNAKDAFDSAKAAVKDAEDAVDDANRAVGEKDTALENLKRRAEEATEEAERTELEAQIPAAETALEQAKTEAAGNVFNIAYGGCKTIMEIFEDISHVLGVNIQPFFSEERKGDIKHSNANIEKARELLGYSPEWDFQRGIRAAIEWYKNNL